MRIYFYKKMYVYFVQDYYNSSEIESEPEGLDYITNLFTVESQVLRQKIRLLITDLFNFRTFNFVLICLLKLFGVPFRRLWRRIILQCQYLRNIDRTSGKLLLVKDAGWALNCFTASKAPVNNYSHKSKILVMNKGRTGDWVTACQWHRPSKK